MSSAANLDGVIKGLNSNIQLNSLDIYLAWASVSWETLPKKGQ